MYGLEVAFILFGALSAGFLSTRWGRKTSLYCCGVLSLVGLCIQCVPNYPTLVAGRVVMGASMGLGSAVSIAYWSEIAPPHMRGMIVVLYQFSINMSNFLGSCINQGTHKLTTGWAYRIPLLVVGNLPLTT